MRRLSSSSSVEGFRLLAKLAFFAVAASLSAQPGPDSATTISREVKDVFEHCAKAVVKIEATDQHGELSGTGFFVDPTGTLYTAYSVGGEAENVTVEFKGKKYPARQLLADLRSGIAMLKVDLASPALPIGSAEQLEIATPVVAIGYPLDLAETPSFGMIGGFDRKCFGGYFSTKHLRVNPPPQRGEGALQIGWTTVPAAEDILDASFFITAAEVAATTLWRGNERLTFSVHADVHPAIRGMPHLPGLPALPSLIAAPPSQTNRAMPLNLQSAPERTP